MTKNKTTSIKPSALPHWVSNLRRLMDENGFNPRSLSLKSGLNATAVRDMLEGRARFPRYDTLQALSSTLHTTPAQLMGEEGAADASSKNISSDDLNLLTEIITRLQETSQELNRTLSPRDFAAMTAAIYRRIQESENRKTSTSAMRTQIHDFLNYELLRQKRSRN